MKYEILDRVLRPEHKAIGLSLELYQGLGVDFLLVNKAGESLPVAVMLPTSPIADILFQADQVLEWSRSRISFTKEEKKQLCPQCGADLKVWGEVGLGEHKHFKEEF